MFSHSSCRFVAEVSPHTLNNANDECTSMPTEAIGTADGGKPNLGIEFELFDDMSMQHYWSKGAGWIRENTHSLKRQ